MQPAPLTGTATGHKRKATCSNNGDATRTPHGDGNIVKFHPVPLSSPGCNPHPSRGRQLPYSAKAYRFHPDATRSTVAPFPVSDRFTSANRGASSKPARFFRHRRCFAAFPLTGTTETGTDAHRRLSFFQITNVSRSHCTRWRPTDSMRF